MTTETTEGQSSDPSVGATTDISVAWHQINWREAERNVRRLQTRIAQATQAGKWGKVKALQRLLTHSLSGKALAVRRVTENTGKRTPGVDGAIWKTPKQKAEAIQSAHPTRIPPASITANVHSQKQWCETAPLDPDHARSSHASLVLAGS